MTGEIRMIIIKEYFKKKYASEADFCAQGQEFIGFGSVSAKTIERYSFCRAKLPYEAKASSVLA